MKMEPIVSSETSAIRTQTPGNYPKRNKLHLEHGESLKTRFMHRIYQNLTHYVLRRGSVPFFRLAASKTNVHTYYFYAHTVHIE